MAIITIISDLLRIHDLRVVSSSLVFTDTYRT